MTQYDQNDKFYVAVDCIILGFDDAKLKLLVINRQIDPFKGSLSLLGNFVKIGETVDDAAKRTLKEFTGLENVYMRELRTYSSIERDPGYRCISVAQYALIRIDEKNKATVANNNAKWIDANNIPSLVLDHNEMIADALKRIETNAKYKPLGFELLPEKFTLPQLQKLYEAIYRRPLDPRNFRKKILSYNILSKLEEKDRTGSKKGAFLYKYDFDKYQKLQNLGYHFEI